MQTIKLIAIISLLLLPGLSLAEIYKTFDEQGNVVYTDTPSESRPSEKVKLRPITPLPKPVYNYAPNSSSSPSASQSKTGAFKYQSLKISSPANDSTVRNQGNFQVKVAVVPKLQKNHKLRLLVNGEVLAGPQKSPVFSVKNMFRGSHQLQVEIIDNKRKAVKTASSTINVHRPIFKPDVKLSLLQNHNSAYAPD